MSATAESLDDMPYNEAGLILQPALLRALLTRAGDGASIEELVAATDAPEDHARYGLIWLLEYGLLSLD